jgi:hypothetical protein
MKYLPLFAMLALLVSSLAACSKHSQAVTTLKFTDLGTIEVVGGKSSSHVLADGRTCILMPTVLPGAHQIQLEMNISDTNAAGTRRVYSLTAFFTPDQVTTFLLDSNNLISLNLHTP